MGMFDGTSFPAVYFPSAETPLTRRLLVYFASSAYSLHFNVTAHLTADWVVQQLRGTFSDSARHRYVILDRDAKFSREVLDLLDSSGIKAVRTSVRSPWQNGVAERWVGSARRDCFDHVIALDEAHVRRLAREYMAHYHADRTHDGLGKDTPSGRAIEPKPAGAELISLPRVGGLHHRYVWKAVARLKATESRAGRGEQPTCRPLCLLAPFMHSPAWPNTPRAPLAPEATTSSARPARLTWPRTSRTSPDSIVATDKGPSRPQPASLPQKTP